MENIHHQLKSSDTLSIYSSYNEPQFARSLFSPVPRFQNMQPQLSSLAEEYRQLLIPIAIENGMVSYINLAPKPPSPQPRKLRKMRARNNLHSYMSKKKSIGCISEDETASKKARSVRRNSNGDGFSDSETLICSEPSSPLSPTGSCNAATNITYPRELRSAKDQYQSPKPLVGNRNFEQTDWKDDVALQVCSDLLMSELGSVLSRQHPLEKDKLSKISGLQILLMIEAYEGVLQSVRRQAYEARKLGVVEGLAVWLQAQGLLEFWLDVLFGLYDSTVQL